MQFRSIATTVALASTALISLSSQAQGMPPMQAQGAVRYVCGGIGVDESSAMRAGMKTHPLSLLFARADGAYLADVGVTITDAAGQPALKIKATGPVCLVDLPAGKYTVEADSGGTVKKHAVTVGATPVTADFRF